MLSHTHAHTKARGWQSGGGGTHHYSNETTIEKEGERLRATQQNCRINGPAKWFIIASFLQQEKAPQIKQKRYIKKDLAWLFPSNPFRCSPGDCEGIWFGGCTGRFCHAALFVLHHDALVQTQHHLDSDPTLRPWLPHTGVTYIQSANKT